MNPKFYIITPVKNEMGLIRDCINSIRDQDYPHWNHFIVDGGSTDETVDIIKWYAQEDSRISYITEPDDGEYHALNKGLERTPKNSSFTVWLNADDKLGYDSVLRDVAALFSDEPSTSIVYGNGITTIHDGQFDTCGLYHSIVCPLTLLSALHWFNGLNTPQGSIYYRNDVFKRLGAFSWGFIHGIDYEFMLRTLSRGEAYRLLNKPLSISRLIRPNARTGKDRLAEFETWYQISKMYVRGLPEDEQIRYWRDYYVYRINNDSLLYEGTGVMWPKDDEFSRAEGLGAERVGFKIALLETSPRSMESEGWVVDSSWEDLLALSEVRMRLNRPEEAKATYFRAITKMEDELCRFPKIRKSYMEKSSEET